jgi:hypothetical protein
MTLWSKTGLEKLAVAQLHKTFILYGHQLFITMFTKVHYRTLSWRKMMHYQHSYHIYFKIHYSKLITIP